MKNFKLHYGATRIVILLFKNVIKIPNFLNGYELFIRGILANLQEIKFSGIHEDLAKVKYYNTLGFYLIMERALLFNLRKINHLKFKEYIENKYKNEVSLKDFLLSDCKPSNWGIINKKIVKIDYGN